MTGPTPVMRGRFDGWQVVLAVFTIMTGASGFAFYNLSVILAALVREGGHSVSFASAMTTLFFLTTALSGLAVGRVIDRHDPRYVITVGALSTAAGMTLVGLAESEALLAAGYVIFATGFTASNLIPCTTIIARRFVRRRAIVLSIASTGLSVGGFILTPLSASLISDLGLSGAMPWLAVGYLMFVVPPALLMPREKPRVDPARDSGGVVRVDGIPYGVAIRGRFFMLMTAAFTLGLMAQVGALAHHFNLAAEYVNPDFAALAVAILAISSMTGRWIGGWLLDHVSIRVMSLAMLVQQAASFILMGHAQGMVPLILVTVLFGLSIGNFLMLLPLTVGEVFGLKDYGKLYSTAQSIVGLGLAAGPGLIGYLYEIFGGYPMPYLAMASVTALGAGLLLLTGPPPKAEGG